MGKIQAILEELRVAVRDHDWHRVSLAQAKLEGWLLVKAPPVAQDNDFAPASEGKNAALEGDEV